MYMELELIYRICLGILKTDQWKPNSKMNQGMSIASTPTLFITLLPRKEGKGQIKREEIRSERLTCSDHGYIRLDREPKPRRPTRFIYRMSHFLPPLSCTLFLPAAPSSFPLLLVFPALPPGCHEPSDPTRILCNCEERALMTRPTNTAKTDLHSTRKQQSTLNR
jgi:hypothetical protein